jgi:hypothetical protein
MHSTRSRRNFQLPLILAALLLGFAGPAFALDFPGPAPGEARAQVNGSDFVLENQVLSLTWQLADGRLKPVALVDKLAGTTLPLQGTECFAIVLDNTPSPGTTTLKASELTLVGKPELGRIEPDAQSLRAADHFAGHRIAATFCSPDGNLEIYWQAMLRDGANYIEQRVTLSCKLVLDVFQEKANRDGAKHVEQRFTMWDKRKPVEVRQIVLLDLTAPQATVMGSVDGSPLVAGNLFFACEHPRSKNELVDGNATEGARRFRCWLPCQTRLEPGTMLDAKAVIGVVPQGQLRRGFLYYLERERAVPYRPLFHYNNGSEIGSLYWKIKLQGKHEEAAAFRQNQEKVWLELIHAFGRELVEKRHAVIDSFAHDFEWDDESLLWQFHQGYPQGFTPAQQAAAKYGSHVSVWLSPWGGYPGKKARVEEGRKLGFETNPLGLSLAGPRYYARFSEACTSMVRRYGVNYFKFDGFGPGNNQTGPGQYASDVDALLRLIGELRALKPDVFINPSTGSWPSPFWLLYADAIWRQGYDTNVAGKGSERQKWISYRDGQILQSVVQRAPLYPVNSLMIHGVFVNMLPLFGNPYDPKKPAPAAETSEVIAEIRSFFATGTNLQEMYIEPTRMTPATWDALAEAARWARANADTLVDTHWIGGDPAKDEVYGFASWSSRKGILSLRNPSDQPAVITVDLAQAFELPKGAPQSYVLKSPWREEASKMPIRVTAGQAQRFELKPFEVLVWEATAEEKM